MLQCNGKKEQQCKEFYFLIVGAHELKAKINASIQKKQTNHELLKSFLLVIKLFQVKTWTQRKINHPVFILSRVRGSIDLNFGLNLPLKISTKCGPGTALGHNKCCDVQFPQNIIPQPNILHIHNKRFTVFTKLLAWQIYGQYHTRGRQATAGRNNLQR